MSHATITGMKGKEPLYRSVWFIASGVFLATLMLFLALYFQSSDLTVQDDAFYHIRHALSYCTDIPEVRMPVYSTMNTRTADLYEAYHALMCPFVAYFPGANATYNGAKVFNSLLNAIFVAFFFLITLNLLKRKDVPHIKAIITSLLSCLYLFTVSYYFFDRLYFIRPEIFGIFSVIASYYAIETKNWRLLALIGFLLPFFYSVSFIALFPTIMFVFASILYNRRTSFKKETWLPFGVTAGSLTLGILLRPDTFNYLYNAYFIHIFAIYNRFTSSTIAEGTELYAPSGNPFLHFLWFIPLTIFLAVKIRSLIRSQSLEKSIDFSNFYLLLLVLFLLPVYLTIQRAAEYFAPFMALLMSGIFIAFYEKIVVWGKEATHRTESSLSEALHSLRSGLCSRPHAIVWFFSLWIMAMFAHTYYDLSKLATHGPVNEYAGAAAYMAENSEDGDIVFNFGIEQYAYLVFFNNTNRYMSGMGSTFMSMYDPSLYMKYVHAVSGSEVCGTVICSNDGKDLFSALKNDFSVKYIVVDEKDRNLFAKTFDIIASDARFQHVWGDAEKIRIYRIQ